MLYVWIVAFALIFMVSLGWYTSLPIVFGVSRGLNASYYGDANARGIATGVEYVGIAWGPAFILFILLWAVISSSKRDVESEYYE